MSSVQVRPATLRDAKAIAEIHVAAWQDAYKASGVKQTTAAGVEGEIDGVRYRLGTAGFASQLSSGNTARELPLPDDQQIWLLLASEQQPLAWISVVDEVRPDAAALIASLKAKGIAVELLSGDQSGAVAQLARQLGIDEFIAGAKPGDKLSHLNQRQAAGDKVLMIGDGINDAPALTAADVGVAMGARGSTAASEAADVVIVEDSIFHLAIAIDVAKGARARALQASGIGMGLAIVAMTAGALGYLDATGSAVAQEFIDAAAILWALVPARSHIHRVAKAKFLRNQTIST